MTLNKLGGVLRPRRQHDVVDLLTVLSRAEWALVAVQQDVRKIVELGDELLDVGGRVRAGVVPRKGPGQV